MINGHKHTSSGCAHHCVLNCQSSIARGRAGPFAVSSSHRETGSSDIQPIYKLGKKNGTPTPCNILVQPNWLLWRASRVVVRISFASFEWISRLAGWLSAVMNLDMDHHFAKAGVELPTPAGAIAARGSRITPPATNLSALDTYAAHVSEGQIRSHLLFIRTHDSRCFGKQYSLRFVILFANIDIFKYILVIDIFILAKSNMGRREYLDMF
jgi:hypothetical protein